MEAVKAIHKEVLAAHAGAHGIRDEALLESAVAAPQATMMGEPLISDPIEIAAAYLFYICGNHPFIDGNKRTALVGVAYLLHREGVEMTVRVDEGERFMLDVAQGTGSVESIAEQLEAWSA